ncbi:MAG: hypothetical protein IJ733_07155 [Lachnospiraceae bacterium]|nr:hypothetical protein [Lachnospiraceae bacterium]
MIKELWMEYRKNWNFDHFKAQNRATGGAIYTLFAICLNPAFIMWNHKDKDSFSELLQICIFALPVIFVYISIFLHPIRRDKMFYLCPMSKEKRLHTLKKDWYFRSALHLTVLLAAYTLLSILYHPSPVVLPFLLINSIGFSMIPGGHSFSMGSDTVEALYALGIWLNSILVYLLQIGFISDAPGDLFVKILIAVMTVIEIGLYAGYAKYIRKAFLATAEYEGRCRPFLP